MNNKTGEQKRPEVPKSERLKARLKRLDQQIAQQTQRERNQEKKKVENLRYLLGRTADTALICGELDLARLEPLVEKHLQKTRDQDFIWQFFPPASSPPRRYCRDHCPRQKAPYSEFVCITRTTRATSAGASTVAITCGD